MVAGSVDDGTVTGTGSVELRLLGRFVVLRDGREVPAADFGGRKVRALLRVLATRRGSLLTHDALTEALWEDRPPADPAANLQVLVNRGRRALGRADLLVTGTGGYALAGGDACSVDAERFLHAVTGARQLAGRAALDAYLRALDGWGGEPLAEDVYADWAAEYRDRLLRARQEALERAADLALELGDAARAVELGAAAAAADPLREAGVLALVRALAASGDPAAALARYADFRRALADELGVDPSPAAQGLHAELLRSGAAETAPRHVRTRALPFGELPFVGRDAELAELLRALGDAGIAVLSGASGAGKSRLLARLARELPVVAVRAYAAEQDEPWSLARSLLREVLAADAAAAQALPPALRAAVGWLLPEDGGPQPVPAPDPESRRALLVEAAVRLLAAAGRPLVVDDLQWADATSLALVEAVLARASDTAAVLALRPREAAGRAAVTGFVDRIGPRAVAVQLGPLEPAELGQLVADGELAAALGAATDRTPLAVVEVLRGLAAEGAVERTARGRWRPTAPGVARRAAELAAEGQRRAIAARAAALDERGHEVLALLAILAREVPARVLAAATDRPEPAVLDALGALAEAGLSRLGELGWTTAHDMVGEVIAERLPADARARLHGRLATALQGTDGDPGELARHWLGAGDAPRAAAAYCTAARSALTQFADVEAMAHADAGLAVAATGELAAALHEARAEARGRLGDIAGARADLRVALAGQGSGATRARLLDRLAMLASGAEDLVRAAELAELALVEAGADPAARARALEIAAVLDMNLDRAERAEQRANEALALYQRLGDANGTARVLDARAMATFLDGAVTRGVELLERAANLFEDAGDLVRVVTPRSTAGHGLVFAGAAEAGLQRTTSALELARALGHPESQTYALWHRAEALAALGRVSDALEAAEEALAIAQQLGHRGWTATGWRAVGIAHQVAGDPDAALAAFRSSLAASQHLNLFACWAAARCALVLVGLGRLDEAEPLVTRALAEGPPLGLYEARLAEVELAAARGAADTARLARQALRAAERGGMAQGRERLAHLAGQAGPPA
jgi:DNA-binding SARP family transcriptional activator